MVRATQLNQLPFGALTFDSIRFGSRETPWDLRILLWKGGAAARSERALPLIESGALGPAQEARYSLVRGIHEELNRRAISGRSRNSIESSLATIRQFFAWADSREEEISIKNVQERYIEWTDHLIHRSRIIKDIKETSAYGIASTVSSVLDNVLDRPTSLIRITRLRHPRKSKRVYGLEIDRQNLSSTFEFGAVLQDICDHLNLDTVLRAKFPIEIPLRRGDKVTHWGPAGDARNRGFLDRFQSEGTLKTRYPIANLRIEAELLMFVAQTGMNVSDAMRTKIRNFRFASHLDGYQVTEVKARRGGAVLFEIFRDFKPHFERYLGWRRTLFPGADLLFPFHLRYGSVESGKFQGNRIRKLLTENKIPYIPPRTLRNTRVNWLLRQSGDPNLTAEMAQHTKQTLLEVYERPSLQRALAEVMRFWAKTDPSLSREAIGPGTCNGTPIPSPQTPPGSAAPDCVRPSGCLWCEQHRDVDSQDYVWSLTSFAHLKRIELVRRRQVAIANSPTQAAIDRINEKLGWFHHSNHTRKRWVEEAHARIEEGEYHPDWKMLINHLEGAA